MLTLSTNTHDTQTFFAIFKNFIKKQGCFHHVNNLKNSNNKIFVYYVFCFVFLFRTYRVKTKRFLHPEKPNIFLK